MEVTQWDSVYEMYKLSLVKFFYNIASGKTPYLYSEFSYLEKESVVPRFSTNFMKHSIQYRGAVLNGTFFQIILITLVILNSFPEK